VVSAATLPAADASTATFHCHTDVHSAHANVYRSHSDVYSTSTDGDDTRADQHSELKSKLSSDNPLSARIASSATDATDQ
jgi:hypothetical protein